jgi:hypothetical protein
MPDTLPTWRQPNRRARWRGFRETQRVRPAGLFGQPHDLLELDFHGPTLEAQAGGGGTVLAYSTSLDLDPPLALSAYALLWPSLPGLDLDDAALGGLFQAFLEFTLDDEASVPLNPLLVDAPGGGAVYVFPPLLTEAESLGVDRPVVQARLVLQADGPGSATATLAPGYLDLYLFRSRNTPVRFVPDI